MPSVRLYFADHATYPGPQDMLIIRAILSLWLVLLSGLKRSMMLFVAFNLRASLSAFLHCAECPTDLASKCAID